MPDAYAAGERRAPELQAEVAQGDLISDSESRHTIPTQKLINYDDDYEETHTHLAGHYENRIRKRHSGKTSVLPTSSKSWIANRSPLVPSFAQGPKIVRRDEKI